MHLNGQRIYKFCPGRRHSLRARPFKIGNPLRLGGTEQIIALFVIICRVHECKLRLFDQLVDEALNSIKDLTSLRPVVEKGLLHHDILREMGGAGLLAELTFMGGTCLRACYRSQRLSEDLDFTGGSGFQN